MKAAVLERPGVLEVKDIPMRKCARDEVLVKVRACGICGSDLRYFKGENPWALHTLGINLPNPPGMILGHEFAGEVVEVGDPSLCGLVGKRVGVEPYNTCGMCAFCRTGRYNLCRNTRHIGHGAGWGDMDYYPGGMAEYCQVWATHVYELPDCLSYEEAAVLDPMAVAVHAVSISGFTPGCRVLVMGSGPVGICIAQVVKAFGASFVYSTDIYEGALLAAGRAGVDCPVDSQKTDVAEHVLKDTDNSGVELVFDTIGTAESQGKALKLLACSGTLVDLAVGPKEISFSLSQLSGERSMKSSSNNLYQDYLLAINLMKTGKVRAGPLITHRFALEDVNKGFDVLFNRSETGAVKVVINI